MVPMCSETSCYTRCHQTCNGLTSNQTRQAKSCGHIITWKFSQHGTGIAEIVIPPPPVFELSTCISAAAKLCSVCNKPIRSCFADLAYRYEHPSSANVCHLSATCSGSTIPRGTARIRALSDRIGVVIRQVGPHLSNNTPPLHVPLHLQ